MPKEMDLLEQAMLDAKTVKETAIQNAKLALEEAFTPRIQSMLSTKLSEELEDEELEDDEMLDEPMDDEMDNEMGDDEFDIDLSINGQEMEVEPAMDGEGEMEDELETPESEYDELEGDEDELGLDEIIRELEEGEYEDDMDEQVKDEAGDDGDGMFQEGAEEADSTIIDEEDEDMEDDISDEELNEMIESVLKEENAKTKNAESKQLKEVHTKYKAKLKEAYGTIKKLQEAINDVNILNAKLLYTNKLFRNFDLNESQKMKVIENFDRASNSREVKLVFSTLAESFNKPKTKKKNKVAVNESFASKATASTKPKKEILDEGTSLSKRWKHLAFQGLNKNN